MKAIFFKFAKAFGKKKMANGMKNALVFINDIDSEAVTDAQLMVIKEERDNSAKKLRTARKALKKDLEETEIAKRGLDGAILALGLLEEELNTAKKARKKEIMAEATEISAEIELKLQPKFDLETRQDAQAQEVADAAQKMFDQMEDILANAGDKLEEAQRHMEAKQSELEHGKLMREMEKGHEAFSGLNIILDAMGESAEEAEDELEVIRMTSPNKKNDTSQLIDDILKKAEEAENPAETDPFRHLSK